MSRTLLSLAGFQVIITGRFWVIAEVCEAVEKMAEMPWPSITFHIQNRQLDKVPLDALKTVSVDGSEELK